MKIPKRNTDKLRMMDFYQIQVNILAHLNKENLDELNLKTLVEEEYAPAIMVLDNALKPARKTGLTEGLLQLDEDRDALLIGFVAYINAFLSYPQEAKAKAAYRLKATLEKYGKSPYRLPQREETAMVNNFLQDLENEDAQNDIKEIYAEPWIKGLKTANTEFEKVYNDRTRIDASVEVGKSKEARNALNEVFQKLINHIEALALLNGKDAYKNLVANINQEIQQAMVAIKQRAAKKEGDEIKE